MKSQRPVIRGKSNPKNQLPPSQILEAETKKMEEKLNVLKDLMNKAAEKREAEGTQIRWKTATDKKPIRNYAKVVLEEKSRIQSRNSLKSQTLTGKPSIEKPSSLKNTSKNQKSPEIFEFCQNLKLPQYYEIFLQNGFEEMEILKEISSQHLTDMKIPPGHQIKIMKALKNDISRETASSNIPKRTDLVELPKRTDLVELPMDNPQMSNIIVVPKETKKKIMKNQETQDNSGENDELNSQQIPRKNMKNQETQENSNGEDQKILKHSNSLKPKSTKNVSFVDKSVKFAGKMCDEGTGTSPKAAKGPPKLSCWNCFKLFEGVPLITYEKHFCSEKCKKIFISLNEVVCERCQSKCLKSQGIFREKGFYCGEQCLPKIEELHKVWAKELKSEEKEGVEQKNWKKVEEEEIFEPIKEINDLDLISDLKTLGNRNKEPIFMSIKDIEEKYKDFNLMKKN